MTHEAGDVASPQLCSRCGRIIVPKLRAPFPPGRAITFQVDISETPPSIKGVVDSVERLSNVPWCDDSPSDWLEAFDMPEESDDGGP